MGGIEIWELKLDQEKNVSRCKKEFCFGLLEGTNETHNVVVRRGLFRSLKFAPSFVALCFVLLGSNFYWPFSDKLTTNHFNNNK